MSYARTERIRRAAILVASLDEPLAKQILAALPPAERERVLDEADRLESIDEDEQADVLAEFRRMTRGTRGVESAVEFAYSRSNGATTARTEAASMPQAAAAELPEATEPVEVRGPAASEADAAAMAELLSHEHPQIIAAALSRLDEEQSAAVFAALPPHLQSEALDRLATLAPADEDAVQEVQSQLERRLQQRREYQARTAAGAEMVRKILARTPPAQRVILLERMGRPDATSALQLAAAERRTAPNDPSPRTAYVDAMAQQARDLASAVRRSRDAPSDVAPEREDLSADLELLSDDSLVAALRLAGEATVLRALAVSGEAFVKRVTNMLPRRQARKLRGMLRNLGPTRLIELQRAQHELLRLAHDCAAVATSS
jgi:flagellar motor switch protein FliG